MIDFAFAFIIIMTNFISFRRSMGMYRFCHRMAVSEGFRKNYAQFLVIFLTAYLAMSGVFCSGSQMKNVIVLTIIIFFLFKPGYTLTVLRAIRRRKYLAIAMAIAIVVMVLFAGTLTVPITLAMILTAAMLFPSDEIMSSRGLQYQYVTTEHLFDCFFHDYFL